MSKPAPRFIFVRFRGSTSNLKDNVYWIRKSNHTYSVYTLSTREIDAHDFFLADGKVYESVELASYIAKDQFLMVLDVAFYLLEIVVICETERVIIDPDNAMQMLALAATE